MQNPSEMKSAAADYWNSVGAKSESRHRDDLWRAYLKDVHRVLRARWIPEGRTGFALKTDLYDEAVSRYDLISLFEGRSEFRVGTDVSLETARAARRRLEQGGRALHCIAVSDARRQSFKSGIFNEILSNSTLDHFPDRADLTASLAELHRILKPGGVLLITLDNPCNPVVWVRNHLPYGFLKRIGIIPYYMGVTLSRSELMRALKSAGFELAGSTAIVHAPRALAIWAGTFLAGTKWEGMKGRFVRLLKAIEAIERLPTKDLTGYFVAVKAIKL